MLPSTGGLSVSSCWFQRTIAGSVPGSVLALIGYSSFVYPFTEWHVAIHWRSLGFLVLVSAHHRGFGSRECSGIDRLFQLCLSFHRVACCHPLAVSRFPRAGFSAPSRVRFQGVFWH